jgi:hypothetical protein
VTVYDSDVVADAVPQERLDRLCAQIQQTGEAVDLPELLLAACKTIGVTRFLLEDQGVMLYRLTVLHTRGVAPPEEQHG